MPAFSRICTMPTQMKYLGDPEPGSEKRFVEGVISSGSVDRMGEVVHPATLYRALQKAFERTGGKGIPYLRDHADRLVIGKVVEFERRGDMIWTKAELLPPGASQPADELVTLLRADIPLSQSIRFSPLINSGGSIWDWKKSGTQGKDGILYWGGLEGEKDIDLMEVSAVTIGANMDADLQLGKSLGLAMEQPWLAESDTRIIAGVALADIEDPEELRFYDDCHRALQALTGMGNITRHWQREGRALSAETSEALLSPINSIAEIAKAGAVLSATNRTAITSAIAALNDVLARDDASKAASTPQQADSGEKTLGSAFIRSLVAAAKTAQPKEAETNG